MAYELNELITKLGASLDTLPLRWSYTHPGKEGVGGFAEIRFEENDTLLIAEIRNWKDPVYALIEDDDWDRRVETFFLSARKNPERGLFELEKLVVDGHSYPVFDESTVELCLSVFHSRAVDININMIAEKFEGVSKPPKRKSLSEATFCTQNPPNPNALNANAPSAPMGVVVPFRPRADAPLQRV